MNGRFEFTDREVEALLGAYALDACEPDEVAAVEAVLARRPDLAAEAARMARAAAWMGAAEALTAPPRMRDVTLATARSRRTGPADPIVDLYLGLSDRFAEVVEIVPDDALSAETANGLSARDLMVHVAAQESLLAQLVGDPTIPAVDETDIDARTAAMVAELGGAPLREVVGLWERSVAANRRWALERRDESTLWRGIELTRRDAIIVRAFETWIHTDDLRRVVGLAEQPPEPRHVALMSDLAGRSLALSLELAGRARPGKTARLVLTGDGGGSWLVAMDGGAPTEPVDVVLSADALDWCRLVGDRLQPADLVCDVEGDGVLADDLLASAPALATL